MEKLYESLQPGKAREMPGMLPSGAISSLEKYLKALVASINAYNVSASESVTSTFEELLGYEWTIEGAQWPRLPMGKLAWAPLFAATAYKTMADALADKSMEERIQWSWDMSGHFMLMEAKAPFGDSQAYWFFYRVLANYLMSVMRALKSAGVDPKYAYSMLRVPGLDAVVSYQLNEAIIDLAARDWFKLGFEDLFTPVQKEVIKETDKQFEEKVASDWASYAAEQAALRAKIESLTSYEKALKVVNTPFETIRKSAGFLTDIMLFLREVPAFVWVAGAATAGYFGFVHPRLKQSGIL